jgi:hypothetical protein
MVHLFSPVPKKIPAPPVENYAHDYPGVCTVAHIAYEQGFRNCLKQWTFCAILQVR